MKYINRSIKLSFVVLVAFFAVCSTAYSAEIDDANVFVEAFNAFQQKDYLLAIEKCDQLNTAFPDSPLKDVTLLLTARASLKSGNNARAAKAITQFTSEFPDSSLKSSVEEELKTLAAKLQKGEPLPADKNLQTAANRVRTDRLARERAAEQKRELERLAKEKAEQDRLARIKYEAEQREKERILAEKLARASMKLAIKLNEGSGPFPVASNSSLPVEITNSGKSSEEFVLSVAAENQYNATLSTATRPDENVTKIMLASGETFKGTVTLRIPPEMVDGHRSNLTVKAVSTRFNDISYQKETIIVSSAPLVRAIAKLAKQKVLPGEKLNYKVTVLNAGSLPAQNLTVKLLLPPQIDFQSAVNAPAKQEQDGSIVFKIDNIDVGRLSEINLEVKIRETSSAGQELRAQVEVVNGNLQRKDIFSAGVSVVQAR